MDEETRAALAAMNERLERLESAVGAGELVSLESLVGGPLAGAYPEPGEDPDEMRKSAEKTMRVLAEAKGRSARIVVPAWWLHDFAREAMLAVDPVTIAMKDLLNTLSAPGPKPQAPLPPRKKRG